MIQEVKNAWIVPIPQIPDNSFNFSFNVTLNGSQYTYVFKFYGGLWHLWAYFPDLTIREAGIFPKDVNWSAYDDFGLLIKTTLDSIGQNDLGKITLYLVEWK